MPPRQSSGAPSVELCLELALGGLSPPSALLRAAREACSLPIVAMVRPRALDDHVEEQAALERDLERVLDLGVERVLSSGRAPSALTEVEALASLIELAGERIAVVPGGGVRARDALELVRRTGARELHSSVVGPGATPRAADVRAPVEALAE